MVMVKFSQSIFDEIINNKNKNFEDLVNELLHIIKKKNFAFAFQDNKNYRNYLSLNCMKLNTICTTDYYQKAYKKYNERPGIEIRIIDINKFNVNRNNIKSFLNGSIYKETKDHTEIIYIDINNAYNYIYKPIKIYVEDKKSDGLFLKNIICYFNRNIDFEKLENDNRIEIVHGGGSETLSRLKEIKTPELSFCIVDSDKLYLNHVNDKEIDYKNISDEKGINLHILSKREIENYIPEKLLKCHKNKNRDKFFYQFNQDQKNYFDMKNGLKYKDIKDENVKKLYKDHLSKDIDEKLKNYKKKIILEYIIKTLNKYYRIKNKKSRKVIKIRKFLEKRVIKHDTLIPGFSKKIYECFNNLGNCCESELSLELKNIYKKFEVYF